MKKKINFFMLLCIVMLFALSVTSFAFEIPAEYKGTNYGASFETTHDECCAPSNSGEINHYEEGYQDGFGDGLASSAITDEEKQAIINEYLSSEAYQQAIENAKAQGVENFKNSVEYVNAMLDSYESGHNEYKNSDEYKNSIQDSFNAGLVDGYDDAYAEAANVMYQKGVKDGYQNFKNTAEYESTLQSWGQSGYDMGYKDGLDNASSESTTNPATAVVLILILFGLFAFYFVIFKIASKKSFKGRK